jgi:hypothetical protein
MLLASTDYYGLEKHETANVAPEWSLETLIANIFDCQSSARFLLARLRLCV